MKNPLQVIDYYSDDHSAATTPEETPEKTPGQTGSASRITFDFSDTPGGHHDGDQPETTPGRSGNRFRKAVAWFITIAIVVLGATLYLRYFNPYTVDARLTGCVLSVEKRGVIFKTYEADFVSREALEDTAHVYTRQQSMTVASESVARRLQAIQGTGKPVTVIYERYYGTLPWRGGSTSVITGIADTNPGNQ